MMQQAVQEASGNRQDGQKDKTCQQQAAKQAGKAGNLLNKTGLLGRNKSIWRNKGQYRYGTSGYPAFILLAQPGKTTIPASARLRRLEQCTHLGAAAVHILYPALIDRLNRFLPFGHLVLAKRDDIIAIIDG